MIKNVLGSTAIYREQVLSHLRVPLFRNGYALLLSGATTSVLGMLYWALAARYYPSAVLGLNSALLSALLLLSGVSQLSLNGVLVRFLPQAGQHTRRLVLLAYGASLIAAVVGGGIFFLGVGLWFPSLGFVADTPGMLASFVVSMMIWGIFSLQDSVLTALRQAIWIPVENTSFAIGKVVLLVALAVPFQQYGIFASWTVPVALALIPVNYFIFRRFLPAYRSTAPALEASELRRQILRFISANYPGTLFSMTSTAALPLLVVEMLGATANAYFYLPWTIMGALQLISLNMTMSFTVEAVMEPAKLRMYLRRVFVHVVRMLVPLVLAVVLFARVFLLMAFGPEYAAEGTRLLQLLALSTLPNAIVLLNLSLARVHNRLGVVVLSQGLLCIGGLGLSCVLIPRFGITGVGIAWLITQTAVALIVALMQFQVLDVLRRRMSARQTARAGVPGAIVPLDTMGQHSVEPLPAAKPTPSAGAVTAKLDLAEIAGVPPTAGEAITQKLELVDAADTRAQLGLRFVERLARDGVLGNVKAPAPDAFAHALANGTGTVYVAGDRLMPDVWGRRVDGIEDLGVGADSAAVAQNAVQLAFTEYRQAQWTPALVAERVRPICEALDLGGTYVWFAATRDGAAPGELAELLIALGQVLDAVGFASLTAVQVQDGAEPALRQVSWPLAAPAATLSALIDGGDGVGFVAQKQTRGACS